MSISNLATLAEEDFTFSSIHTIFACQFRFMHSESEERQRQRQRQRQRPKKIRSEKIGWRTYKKETDINMYVYIYIYIYVYTHECLKYEDRLAYKNSLYGRVHERKISFPITPSQTIDLGTDIWDIKQLTAILDRKQYTNLVFVNIHTTTTHKVNRTETRTEGVIEANKVDELS